MEIRKRVKVGEILLGGKPREKISIGLGTGS